jgi:intein-encoded DNA endonuclease-like protein
MQKIKPSDELDAKIIAFYLAGNDTYDTADEYKCSQTFVMNTLKRHNISKRTTQSYTTKYIPNEKFFDIIDSEEKAYVLGFFYADGNNYIKDVHSYEVSVGLQEEDKLILEKMRDLLSPQTKLKFTDYSDKGWKNQFKLKINSKLLSEQLTKLGCVTAKSLTLTWPEWLIDPELQRHFIRGYFDGDGSLYAKKPTKTGQIDWGWQITSTNNFCTEAKKLIGQYVNVHCSQSLAHSNLDNNITATLSIGGNVQVKQVLDWMYKDATIYMDRKYNKYQEFLQYLIKNPGRKGRGKYTRN